MPLVVLAGITAAGTVYSALKQHEAGQQAKAIGDFNASIAEQQATDALSRGQVDEERFRQGVRALIGSQRAGFASQGVDVGSGSALATQADASYLGELDALTIRNNAAREAWGYKVQAQDARMGGQYQAQAANAQAVSTVVGGVGAVGGMLGQRYGWFTPKGGGV